MPPKGDIKMKIVNLTPHTINVCNEDETLLKSIPASGDVARVSVQSTLSEVKGGIPIYKTNVGEATS